MFHNSLIEKIAESFNGVLVRTPCVYSPFFSEVFKAKIFFKLENFQRTGSFKERGALNFLLRRNNVAHVVTASAGNHAQAVALHAGRLSVRATIFMPIGTSNTKVLETERLKAHVKLAGENYDEAYKLAKDYAECAGAHFLHGYDDEDVICGQATVALEVLNQVDPDIVVVPIGGGGLIAGIGQYISNSERNISVIGVESNGFQSMACALKGEDLSCANINKTIAEGIAVKRVGQRTKEICQNIPIKLATVKDNDIQSAITLLLERQKIVAEGAGAASVALLFNEHYLNSFYNKKVVFIISGGNIDMSLLARLTARELVTSRRWSQLSLVIKDTPGSLAALLKTITAASGNIIDIRHERYFAAINWNEVLVIVTLETRNDTHEQDLLNSLKKEGYSVLERVGA